jgi:hypothetical protein
VQGRAVKRWRKSLASRVIGSRRSGRMGVAGAEEAMMVMGASVIGGRRFSIGMSARETRLTTSSNRW